jgi:multiple sugar transport system permease protein
MATSTDSTAATVAKHKRPDRPTGMEHATPWLFILPSVLLLLAVGLYPIGYTFFISFHSWTLGQAAPSFIALSNYVEVLTDGAFLDAVGRTMLLLVITLPIQLALGLGIALLLHTHFNKWLRTILQVALVIPIAITPAVLGLLVQVMFDNQFGIINHALASIGIEGVNWLGDQTAAYVTVCIAQIWQWTPFAALVVSASLATVPSEIEEAALLETSRWWPRFRRVVLPYLWPGITAVLVFQTAFVIKQFGMVYSIQKGGPGSATQLAMLEIERTAFRGFDIGAAAAQSILMLVLSILLAQTYIKLFYREAA